MNLNNLVGELSRQASAFRSKYWIYDNMTYLQIKVWNTANMNAKKKYDISNKGRRKNWRKKGDNDYSVGSNGNGIKSKLRTRAIWKDAKKSKEKKIKKTNKACHMGILTDSWH